MVARLRRDAALYEPPPPPVPGRRGRKPQKGPRHPPCSQGVADPQTLWCPRRLPWYGGQRRRLQLCSRTALWHHDGWPPVPIRWGLVHDPTGHLRDEAFLCPDVTVSPLQSLAWVIQRWSVEVTFEESRAHLGIETQRQWTDRAVQRTTPTLFALFALGTVMAYHRMQQQSLELPVCAWYRKRPPTFADLLALVRKRLWAHTYYPTSVPHGESGQFPPDAVARLLEQLCYAA